MVRSISDIAVGIEADRHRLQEIARSNITMSVRVNHTIDGRTLAGETGIHGRDNSVQTPCTHEGYEGDQD
jgi:hypothetical protein